MIFNAGMIPKENPRHRKAIKHGRKRLFNEAILGLLSKAHLCAWFLLQRGWFHLGRAPESSALPSAGGGRGIHGLFSRFLVVFTSRSCSAPQSLIVHLINAGPWHGQSRVQGHWKGGGGRRPMERLSADPACTRVPAFGVVPSTVPMLSQVWSSTLVTCPTVRPAAAST